MKNENINRYNGFPPLIFHDSKILILGSFPSVKSRENKFYYGNPRNRFWSILTKAFNEELPKNIDDKKELCRKHKIALWDVYAQSDLNGSSDVSLDKSNYILADLNSLLINYTNIQIILCNGALAYNTFIKNFKTNLPIKKLHSTSPACVKCDVNEWIKSLNEIN